MAHGRAWGMAWGAGLWLAAGAAAADASAARERDEREGVVVVAATVDGAPSKAVLPALDRVRVQLGLDGRDELRPDIVPRPRPVAVAEARALGRTAFSALSTERPEAVAAQYEGKILEALQSVSSVRDSESRGVLWNLCVLRVHLRALSDDPEVRSRGAHEAAGDCARQFRERPPLGKVWPEEVVRAFDAASREARYSSVALKSAPAGCEALVYGTSVGLTPVVVDLAAGTQEVQVVCGGAPSALHRVQVDGSRDLVIRSATDGALIEGQGGPELHYATREALRAAVHEDAATLAAEVGADAFVVVEASGADAEVAWQPLGGDGGGRTRIAGGASSDARAQSIAALFHGAPASEQGPAASGGRSASRMLDYVVGGGLVLAGGAVAAAPLVAVARDGECADSACSHVYDGGSGTSVGLLVGAGVLVGSGVAVMVWRPFGRRAAVAVGASSIQVKGTF